MNINFKQKNKKLAKNTIIIFISKFLTQLSSLVVLPFLTACLSAEDYGTFDLINNYAWLIVPYLTLEIENGLFRYLIDLRDEKNNDNKISVISSGILIILIQYIFSILVFLVIHLLFKNINIIYVYIYATFAMILNLNLFITRGFGKNIDYAVASIISGLINILLSIILICFYHLGIIGLVISGCVGNFIATIYLIIKNNIFKFINLNKIDLINCKKLFNYSVPLVPNATCSWITSVSDRTMLSILVNASATGIYSVSTKFSTILTHLVGVFNLSWSEIASETSKSEDRDNYFSKTIDSIFFLCFSVCIIIIGFMPIIFRILINNTYIESFRYIPYLIFASVFEIFSTLLGAIYVSLKKSKNIAISTIAASAINIIINLLFMRKHGIIIACISTIISFAFLSTYRYIDLKRVINLKLNIKKYILSLFAFIIIFFFYSYDNFFFITINILISIIFSLYLNYSMLRVLLNNLFNKNM